MYIKKIILLIIMVLSCNAFSVGKSSGGGKITELFINKEGTLAYVKFSSPIVDVGCEKKEFYVAELNDTVGSNRLYSSMLAAFMAQNEVAFYIDGCSTWPYWGATRGAISTMYMFK